MNLNKPIQLLKDRIKSHQLLLENYQEISNQREQELKLLKTKEKKLNKEIQEYEQTINFLIKENNEGT